ncbi:MAG TPA: phytanoyl-CoA dioxygenase family protein [Candidatus Binatia bacterium]|nr:phytanoyl-CoA dioxygenase family protein [Candidatus Binatia bacterium]
MLDATARTHWTRHGWLWLRGFFGVDEMRDLVRWTDEIASWPETPGRWMRYYERPQGAKLLARIENFVPYHEGLAELFASPRLLGLLAELCGEPVVLFKDKINFKLPGGGGFAPHQDAPAYVDFGVEHHLTVMVPIDAFTAENGCLEMARDACARTFLPQNPDGTLRAGVMEGLEVEPLRAVPGDAIVFDAWAPHRSGPNRSSGPRRSYYLTFNPASAGDRRAAYYARKRECFPPEYERDPDVDYAARGRQFNLGNPFD